MPIGILFWVIFVVALLFGGYVLWPLGAGAGMHLAYFILIGLLGWQVFGAVVRRGP